MNIFFKFSTSKPTITRYANKKGPDFSSAFKIFLTGRSTNSGSVNPENNQANPQQASIKVW
jgi:hypothetical protein